MCIKDKLQKRGLGERPGAFIPGNVYLGQFHGAAA